MSSQSPIIETRDRSAAVKEESSSQLEQTSKDGNECLCFAPIIAGSSLPHHLGPGTRWPGVYIVPFCDRGIYRSMLALPRKIISPESCKNVSSQQAKLVEPCFVAALLATCPDAEVAELGINVTSRRLCVIYWILKPYHWRISSSDFYCGVRAREDGLDGLDRSMGRPFTMSSAGRLRPTR